MSLRYQVAVLLEIYLKEELPFLLVSELYEQYRTFNATSFLTNFEIQKYLQNGPTFNAPFQK